MARVTPLTDAKIRNLKPKDKEYKVADGDGLYLHIMPNGSKLWRIRFSIGGKSTTRSLGRYPDVSLKEARSKRYEYKSSLKNGIDPKATLSDMTILSLMDEYFSFRKDLKPSYIKNLRGIINRDFRAIHYKKIDDITTQDLITCFKSAEARGITTATRKAGYFINRLFKYAVTMQYTTHNPMQSIDLGILLQPVRHKNYPHITDTNELSQLLRAIDSYFGDPNVKAALQLLPYVFVRPSNIRHMQWDEIDFSNKMWIIPGEKMKMKRDHMVPLTDTTLSIITSMQGNQSPYVFHSPTAKTRPLSENTLGSALKRLGYKGIMTSHGFRHTASTILHENMHVHNVSSEAIEMQLAHVDGTIRGVYNKALYIEERRRLMQWWSDFLDALKYHS